MARLILGPWSEGVNTEHRITVSSIDSEVVEFDYLIVDTSFDIPTKHLAGFRPEN